MTCTSFKRIVIVQCTINGNLYFRFAHNSWWLWQSDSLEYVLDNEETVLLEATFTAFAAQFAISKPVNLSAIPPTT